MSNLPANFEWLNHIGVLPRMVQEGIKILGVTETPGSSNNPVIIQMAQDLLVGDIYTSDSTQPWCALSHCWVAIKAGKLVVFKDRYDYLRAKAFVKLGVLFCIDQWEVIDRKDAMLGDTCIFDRPGGGHIFVYVGESPTHLYGHGGNQNNCYSFTRVAKERLYAIRRPKYIVMPPSVKKYFLTDIGVPVTSNEQ